MNRNFLEDSLWNLYPTLYSLSFSLIPESLQAEQICLDVLDLLILNDRKLLERILDDSSGEEGEQLSLQLRDVCLRHAWSLGIKRCLQLKDSLNFDSDLMNMAFYQLDAKNRGIIFLKASLKLALKDMQSITNCDRYEILSRLSHSRDQLLKEKTKRPLTSSTVAASV